MGVTPVEQYMIATGRRLFKGYDTYDELNRFIFDLETQGLNPKRHRIEQIEYIKSFCKKNNLLLTGGSDFHREQKQTLAYVANGTIPITEEYCFKKIYTDRSLLKVV